MESNKRLLQLKLNTITSFLQQIVSLIAGLIVPRMLLLTYGTEVNGLVNSITQFLGVISFLQLGVGAVVQAALYKPLAEGNQKQISEIMKSANNFFQKIALGLVVYTIIMMIIYPMIIARNGFDLLYVNVLICAISVGSILDYCFGIVDGILLTADQKAYIIYILRIVGYILNTIVVYFLIKKGQSIQLVKFASSIVFVLRPIIQRIYIIKNYNIDYKIKYEYEPIKQKWNGIAQHLAAFVLNQTDVIVLTVFATLSDVSVYGVYCMVLNGIKLLITSLTYSMQNLMGELWAEENIKELERLFRFDEWVLHSIVVIIYGCTSVLICPFVKVYTLGIKGADFIQSDFAILITIAFALNTLKIVYTDVVFATGRFKETQSYYFISAFLNIVLSVFFVSLLGLVGVALGTVCAMMYLLVKMIRFNTRNVLCIKIKKTIKLFSTDIIVFVFAYFISLRIPMYSDNYLSWLYKSIYTLMVWVIVFLFVNTILNRDYLRGIIKKGGGE